MIPAMGKINPSGSWEDRGWWVVIINSVVRVSH